MITAEESGRRINESIENTMTPGTKGYHNDDDGVNNGSLKCNNDERLESTAADDDEKQWTVSQEAVELAGVH